ncbi:MAG: hypothetical protein R3A44_39180 [Caldilineaceae bacterium]
MALAMLVFLLSLTGIPLTGGFMEASFMYLVAAVQHQYFFLAVAGFVNAGIAAGYYLRVVAAAFMNRLPIPAAVKWRPSLEYGHGGAVDIGHLRAGHPVDWHLPAQLY